MLPDGCNGDFSAGDPTTIQQEIVRHHQEGTLVYCRYGEQYVLNLERQSNAISNLPMSSKCASFLINVKKLIKDHNIDSTEHNLYRMKTQNNVTK